MSQPVCIVTGGGRGIGRACALRQANVGDHVVVWDLNGQQADAVAKEIAAAGGSAEGLALDVADTEATRSSVEAVRARYGRIDRLVHAAGVVRVIHLANLDEAEYDRLMNVNLRAAFFITQAIARAMEGNGGGAIVLFASIAARKPRPIAAHYAASKAAIINFTASAAHTYGPSVRVNAVSPGVIETEMFDQINRELADIGVPRPEPANAQALKRRGEPDDVAKVVEFLLGPLACYVTGQTINVDGGME